MQNSVSLHAYLYHQWNLKLMWSCKITLNILRNTNNVSPIWALGHLVIHGNEEDTFLRKGEQLQGPDLTIDKASTVAKEQINFWVKHKILQETTGLVHTKKCFLSNHVKQLEHDCKSVKLIVSVFFFQLLQILQIKKHLERITSLVKLNAGCVW